MTKTTSKTIRMILGGLGFSALAVAMISFPLPGFPSSLFLIASVVLFARSSPTLERWLREHRVLGTWIKRIEAQKQLSVRKRLLLVCLFWCGLLVSWLLFRDHGLPAFEAMLLGTGILVALLAVLLRQRPAQP